MTWQSPFPMTMANVPPQQQIEILQVYANITLTMLGEVTDEVLINFIREFFSSDGDLQNILRVAVLVPRNSCVCKGRKKSK